MRSVLCSWISDLFMERAKVVEMGLFSVQMKAPGLSDTYGEEFEELYEKYEREEEVRKLSKHRNLDSYSRVSN